MTDASAAPPKDHGRAGRDLPKAVASAVVLLAAIGASLLFWKPAFMVIVVAAVVVAVWELRQGLLAKDIDLPQEPLMLGGAVMVVVAYLSGTNALVTATAVSALVVMLWLLRRGIAGYVKTATASVFTLIYVPFLGSFVALMLAEGGRTGAGLDDDGVAGILTFILVTIASDIGGYIAGVLFGKHPMAPVISPEEVVGGVRRLAGVLPGRRLGAGGVPPRRRVVGRAAARPHRRRDGHARRPVRVGDEARPRDQGHEPGDPGARRSHGPARLAARHHRPDLAAPAPPRLHVTLFLVRHGRPVIDRERPAAEWPLDPAGYDDIWALRDRLPAGAAFYSSPEPKALQTAQLLTDDEVGVVEGLREHRREAGWVEDFAAVVRRAVDDPETPALAGWEPLRAVGSGWSRPCVRSWPRTGRRTSCWWATAPRSWS